MNMWQEGTVLPIKDVRISSGMVHGTCPILVEGNEYIFRLDFYGAGAFLTFFDYQYNLVNKETDYLAFSFICS